MHLRPAQSSERSAVFTNGFGLLPQPSDLLGAAAPEQGPFAVSLRAPASRLLGSWHLGGRPQHVRLKTSTICQKEDGEGYQLVTFSLDRQPAGRFPQPPSAYQSARIGVEPCRDSKRSSIGAFWPITRLLLYLSTMISISCTAAGMLASIIRRSLQGEPHHSHYQNGPRRSVVRSPQCHRPSEKREGGRSEARYSNQGWEWKRWYAADSARRPRLTKQFND